MQIILLENIEGLGRKGDQVQVREGYGRNHLLPQRKALLASPGVLSRLTAMKKKFAVEEQKIVTALQGVAGKLEGLTLTLTMRATPEGHLFGSVSPHVLADALKEKGHEVAARDFRIKDPIKEVGTYPVAIHLHADVKVGITVVVEAEGGTDEEGDAPAEGAAAPAAADAGADAAGKSAKPESAPAAES
jgi:large subunit ribosomal protein L9